MGMRLNHKNAQTALFSAPCGVAFGLSEGGGRVQDATMNPCEPLCFSPVYQTYLWGGCQLSERYGRSDAPADGPVAESWELSDRTDGMSVVATGTYRGRTLRELMQEHREAIMGPAFSGTAFPLLIKLIDARETLSVQVHPDDAAAAAGHGEAKSEAWYVLEAAPGACVYRGLREGADAASFNTALDEGRVEELLLRYSVSAGDTIYIPGGTVHAIGAGCLLLEVQQNSNTTYRLFDWNRVGPDGKPRALHVEQARPVIHWDVQAIHQPADEGRCLTPYFTIEPVALGRRPVSLTDPLRGCTVVFVERGPVEIRYGDGAVTAREGTTWLLPAALIKPRVVSAEGVDGRVVLVRGVAGA
jgi:mannose-6-phosphate isomerase